MVEKLTIKNLRTNNILIFDMEDADYLLYEGCIDWGSVETEHNTYQYVNQIGSTITDTTLGNRDVSISGWIIGKDLSIIESKKKVLFNLINPLSEVEVQVGAWIINGKPNTNVRFSNNYKENNEVMCKFLIQIFCANPLFIMKSPISKKISQSIGSFHFPLTLPKEGIIMSSRRRDALAIVGNDGQNEIGLTITLKANGIVNNPTIINTNTFEKITINKILHSNEKIVIKTQRGQRSVVGKINGIEENYLDYFDWDNTWLQLPLGTSIFTVYSTNSEGEQDDSYKLLDVTITYNLNSMNLVEE